MLNPTVFKIKMEHWLDSSAFIKANESDLSPAEITAVDFLLNAWRSHDFSPELSAEAKENINILVRNDEFHGNSPQLKTKMQRFRGSASTIYTTDAETYEQFRSELALRLGVSISHRPFSGAPRESPATPPSPPPPAGKAQLDITSATVDILTSRGGILRNGTTSIPQGTLKLRPNLNYTTTVVGSRWKVTCRIVDSNGNEVTRSVTECTASAQSGMLALKDFGQATLTAGGYRLLAYVNGDKRVDVPVSVTLDKDHTTAPYTLKINDIASADESGNRISAQILTTAQFLTATVEIDSLSTSSQYINLRVSIYTPSGKLLRNAQSPVGCTTLRDVEFRGRTTVALRPWGNKNGNVFTEEGHWRMEIKLPDGRIVQKRFNVLRPRSTSSPLEISDTDFYLPETRIPAQTDNESNYADAPEKQTSHITPRILFSLNYAVDVAEISYAIFKSTNAGSRLIFRSRPQNYAIGGKRSLLLESSRMLYEQFVPGTYGIQFTVNGVDSPVEEFIVREKSQIGWMKMAAVLFIIAMFVLCLIM